MVRDLLSPRRVAEAAVVPLELVEPATSIAARFVSSAMSLGSLSPEAHATLAAGMRLLGGSANTGEGGEDPAMLIPGPDGVRRDASIKQVASGRFGVTAEYLALAEQLEIKMAQGSKPGEGGQLPGAKVSELIATLRRVQPGQTVISPPPHHDIYSIEDLAQLITDLRAINPTARIGVKLVATTGVGTIAAGVAKAHADYVLISGHSGGTGASPLSSIKHVGLPWELGLAEAHQVLVHHGLRDRVALRVDGGFQTGRDVVVAAMLGAEEFGFGTAALVAMGCDMARQCHLDTCPTGIATQREDLRAKFTGTPEQVVEFFLAIAEDVRRELAVSGFASVADAVGRVDRLVGAPDSPLDLDRILDGPAWVPPATRRERPPKQIGRLAVAPIASGLDERLTREAVTAISNGRSAALSSPVSTDERTLGAVLTGALVRQPEPVQSLAGAARADGGPLAQIVLDGAAGQSLGAFLGAEARIVVTGVANDYVGKGLSGGTIVVRPPRDAGFVPGDAAIAGNACLYGATGGRLHLVGRAGIRFAVRNSGAVGVVEGVGAHGCEYMTGGLVVVLGPIGRNFGAGMTGGRAFVHDPSGAGAGSLATASVVARPLNGGTDEDELRGLLHSHADAGSARAHAILADWPAAREQFLVVSPRPV
jgi:glutamate synthase domain-containing protein 2/glutamate synthase domain-containing protein 3